VTTIARRIVSEPVRDATATWQTIVNLLAPSSMAAARSELLSVTGIACSLIAGEAFKDAPAVMFGTGPRIRIYCLYGDDAMTGDGATESALASSPVSGEWALSLPCEPDDLEWVSAALKKRSSRITARDLNLPVEEDEKDNADQKSANVNVEAFLRP
jgi:hypothetical protein